MAAPLSVNATIGDITLNFNNSCNCCCFGKPQAIKPESPVFVNRKGEGVPFKKKKPGELAQSIEASNRYLVQHLESVSARVFNDKDKIPKALKTHKVVDLSRKAARPLCVYEIQKINEMVQQCIQEGSPLKDEKKE